MDAIPRRAQQGFIFLAFQQQHFFRLFMLADVHNHADKVVWPSLGVPHTFHRQMNENYMSVFMDITLLQLVGIDFPANGLIQ